MKKLRCLCAPMVIIGLGLCSAPAALAGTDVQVNTGAVSVQNEVSVTLNPNTPGNVVIAYNDNPSSVSTVGLGIGFSLNNGLTWTDRQIGASPNTPTDPVGGATLSDIFDPVTGADNSGNVYAGYIATDGSQGGPSGVYVHRSTDGGNSWTLPIAVHNEGLQALVPPGSYRFNDKPHLEVDRFNLNLNGNNSVYLAWVQDDGVNPQTDVRFSASLDNGNTWFPTPATINDNPGIDLGNGPNVAVAPNGDVYVAWLDVDVTNNNPGPKTGILYVDKSIDGGMTWSTDLLVKNVATLPNHLSTLNNQANQDDVRARGYPVIAADPNDATGQSLYITFAEDPDGSIAGDEADIFFMKTIDGGLNWTPPLRINDDITINDQFAPWMAVKPDGTIDIVWYDKRNDANDAQWDVYFANSTDGGSSFSTNLRVSDQTFATALATNNEPWLGEYLGIAVDGSFAYIGFTSSVNDSNGDVFFDRIPNAPVVAGLTPEPNSLPLAGLAIGLLSLAGLLSRRMYGLRGQNLIRN